MYPWTKLVTAIFQFVDVYYLLIVAYTSKFPIVCKLSSVKGVHIANQCKQIFSEYGWPEILTSDNGPCYTSQAFTSVMKFYNVHHIAISLHDLQRDLQRGISRLLRACYTKLRRKENIFSSVLCSIILPPYR